MIVGRREEGGSLNLPVRYQRIDGWEKEGSSGFLMARRDE
jgi:hypothetical protein